MPTLTPGAITIGDATIAVTATDATAGSPPFAVLWQTSDDAGATWGPAFASGGATLSAVLLGLAPGTTTGVRVQYTDTASVVSYASFKSIQYTVQGNRVLLRWFVGP